MKKILLVDDELMIRDSMSKRLRSADYEVLTAENGWEAIEIFEKHHPDLVLLDVMMVGMDGYLTCRELRKRNRETPIIFLTGLDADEDQLKGLEAGADDYLIKTASPAIILARIKAAFDRFVRLSCQAAPDTMTKLEADLYRLLKSRVGAYFSYGNIFDMIFGYGYSADEGAIRTHISRMRKKLPPGEEIESKRGFGFRLVKNMI